MRALVQRVRRASVSVDGSLVGDIGFGLAVFLGVASQDGEREVAWMAHRVTRLRVFSDKAGKMRHDVLEAAGSLLIVSHFTLYGDVSRGHRPDFGQAAGREIAEPLYDLFIERCRDQGVAVATGIFGASMNVELVNLGPVTLWLESPKGGDGDDTARVPKS